MKRLKSNLYIKGKFGKDWVHRETLNLDTECLYEEGRRKSNIKTKDLPDSYAPIRSRTIWYMDGWINTSDVKYVYATMFEMNHYRKDDYLYISYNKPITLSIDKYGYKNVQGYDYCICAADVEIIRMYIKRYSPDCDMSQVNKTFRKKDKFLKEKYPEELPDYKLKWEGNNIVYKGKK